MLGGQCWPSLVAGKNGSCGDGGAIVAKAELWELGRWVLFSRLEVYDSGPHSLFLAAGTRQLPLPHATRHLHASNVREIVALKNTQRSSFEHPPRTTTGSEQATVRPSSRIFLPRTPQQCRCKLRPVRDRRRSYFNTEDQKTDRHPHAGSKILPRNTGGLSPSISRTANGRTRLSTRPRDGWRRTSGTATRAWLIPWCVARRRFVPSRRKTDWLYYCRTETKSGHTSRCCANWATRRSRFHSRQRRKPTLISRGA